VVLLTWRICGSVDPVFVHGEGRPDRRRRRRAMNGTCARPPPLPRKAEMAGAAEGGSEPYHEAPPADGDQHISSTAWRGGASPECAAACRRSSSAQASS
jgi:hypothetical protein